MQEKTMLETVLKKDRVFLIGGLVIIILMSWIYILTGAGMDMNAMEMTDMVSPKGMGEMMPMMGAAVWSPSYAILMFFMWWIMMVAMMLPSASPTILLYALVSKKNFNQNKSILPTSLFAWGYLVSWGIFSLIATALQWWFESVGWLTPMLSSSNTIFGGLLLILAGVYQLTPIKRACLKHCRNPILFLHNHWHSGNLGAFRMGIFHGFYCLACCWFLMGLLFVGGVMNLYWIAGLAIYVLIEKSIPTGHWFGSLTGIVLSIWGVWMLFF